MLFFASPLSLISSCFSNAISQLWFYLFSIASVKWLKKNRLIIN